MSNLLESGNSQESGYALRNRLRLLRQAYLNGTFTEPTTVPMPEIVADGQGPDNWIGGSGESAPCTDGGYRRDAAFRVAPDLQGRPFCLRCGVVHRSFGEPCPVCGDS